MKELFSFYLFLAKVVISLVWLLFLTGLSRAKKYKIAIFLAVISINLITLIWLNTLKENRVKLIETPTPPPYASIAFSQDLTKQQINLKIQQLEAVLTLQPTHVDTLINLGLIYDGLGNKLMAEKYWNQAKNIDPYHQFFKPVD